MAKPLKMYLSQISNELHRCIDVQTHKNLGYKPLGLDLLQGPDECETIPPEGAWENRPHPKQKQVNEQA